MNKIILLSVIVGNYMFAGIQEGNVNCSSKAKLEQYSWSTDSSDEDLKIEAGRRRGKKNRGDRRRGGGGLR